MFSNSLRRSRICVASLQKAGTLAISKPFASPNSLLELANPLLSACLRHAKDNFWHNANVVESKNAVVTLYATVVYADQQTEKILYRSTEPIAVHIDTDDLNSITIPDLPSCCVSKFSTKVEVMDYSYGVLTIEGKDKNNSPFVVSLI